ncbi:MAG: hypothetical protein CBD58_00985 [bacterium TMED198]|nr:MAG: hypothetical protein CBD58_00985 [bacterium TMED198]|tara:strand:- start:3049 stop:4131 length:1083 start_codon:yes stop_codon:yes gene_type:complete
MAIYKNFNIVDESSPESGDVVSNVKDIVSSGMWADGSTSITAFFTSSTQSGSTGDFFLDVYSANPQSDSTSKPQFSIAYANFNGSGSLGAVGVNGNRAAAGIYRQLSNTLLGPDSDQFTFAGSAAGSGGNLTKLSPDYVYAISISRRQLREKMDPGNWELVLSGSGALLGANNKIKLIDDSGATTNPSVQKGGRVFNVVSGSIASGTAVTKTTAAAQPGGAYGLFYPDLGIIILNGPILNASASLSTNTTSNDLGGNNDKLFQRISDGAKFQARREEVITSQHYFCRVPNKEFNFSSNPTFVSGSAGNFQQATFFKNPKSFITQVGLYNNANELLAVAKLSKPLLKSYSREAIIKVKLDF